MISTKRFRIVSACVVILYCTYIRIHQNFFLFSIMFWFFNAESLLPDGATVVVIMQLCERKKLIEFTH